MTGNHGETRARETRAADGGSLVAAPELFFAIATAITRWLLLTIRAMRKPSPCGAAIVRALPLLPSIAHLERNPENLGDVGIELLDPVHLERLQIGLCEEWARGTRRAPHPQGGPLRAVKNGRLQTARSAALLSSRQTRRQHVGTCLVTSPRSVPSVFAVRKAD